MAGRADVIFGRDRAAELRYNIRQLAMLERMAAA